MSILDKKSQSFLGSILFNGEYRLLKNALSIVKKEMPYIPDVAIVLGSGMGSFVDYFKVDKTISYKDIKGMPVSTVDGHTGQFVFFKCKNKNVVCMQGRVHLYEGYEAKEVVRPTRLLGMMGVKDIIFTNAAGAVNNKFRPGDLMMITDQINLFIRSPLMGYNIDELGIRFPDMSNLYNVRLQNVIRSGAEKLKIDLKEGIYCQLYGPHFESEADIRALSMIGVSSVAMSTGIEAIAAHHMGLNVAGLSYISNMATGLGNPISHEELLKNSKNTVDNLIRLFEEIIDKI